MKLLDPFPAASPQGAQIPDTAGNKLPHNVPEENRGEMGGGQEMRENKGGNGEEGCGGIRHIFFSKLKWAVCLESQLADAHPLCVSRTTFTRM